MGSNRREKLLAILVLGSLIVQIGAWLLPNPFTKKKEEVNNVQVEQSKNENSKDSDTLKSTFDNTKVSVDSTDKLKK